MHIVSGIITEVKKLNALESTQEKTIFKVKWIEKDEIVTLSYSNFPIRKNDCIYACCHLLDQQYIVIKPPMVLISKDKETMIVHFMICLTIKYPEASQFYESLLLDLKEDNIYDTMTFMAEKWHNHNDQKVLDMFQDDRIKQVLEYWYREYNLRELKLLGLTYDDVKEYGKTCKELYTQCIKNPYSIYHLDIDKCDMIIARLNKPMNKDEREKGLIVRQIYKNNKVKQWMSCPTTNISKQFPGVKKHLESLKSDYDVVIDMQHVYLKKYHKIETGVSDFICNYVNNDPVNNHLDPIDVVYKGKNNADFIRYKMLENLSLSPDQEIAVQSALDHKMLMILGGAGVGKSSMIGEVVKNLKFRNLKFILTGFTGKAVSRLQEITKEKAYTMHKLIHDAKKVKPEPCDYVIIDEISMVSTELLYDFIKCYPDVNQYLFVGDNKQLQPIDAGCFLDELLKASVVPTYYLTTNHRVKNNPGDGILLNANLMINHDTQYPFEFVETENFQIINGGIENVFEIVQGCYDAGVDVEDIMIISPYKDYVKCLNTGCKKIYNKNTLSANDKYGNIWTVGDKVVLLKNIGQILYNGQQGIVTDVHPGYITINFGDAVHQFKTNSKYNNDEHNTEMNVFKLQHSYANTLHKNQGQEASIVIIFIDERESNFINQPLLYTAVTRGKDIVYIITPNTEMLNNGVCRKPYFRYDNLGSRLKSLLPPITPVKYIKPKISTSDLFKDDPDLQGMEEEEYYDD